MLSNDDKKEIEDYKLKVLMRYLIIAAENKRFVAYEEINKLLGTSLQQSGKYAGMIGDKCMEAKLPGLNALIISRDGIPGQYWFDWYKTTASYAANKPTFAEAWSNEVALCIKEFHQTRNKKDKFKNTKKVQ